MYQLTQKQFGHAAEAYSRSVVFAEGEDLEWLVEHARHYRQTRVLDLGTGAGHAAFALSSIGDILVGVDITPQMITVAYHNAEERNIKNFQGIVGNAEHLPFPDESFSLIVCRYAGHHFHNPARVVQEVARMLTMDGRLLIVDNTSPDDPSADRWINTVELLRDPSHVREWSKLEWQQFLQAAGLSFAVSHTWQKMLEFDDWLTRQQTPPAQATQLERLFAEAPPQIRKTFAIESNSFCLLTRLMVGRKENK